MEFSLLIIIGIIAGILSGMFGIGGGIFIVPALMLVLKYSQLESNGTSLAALLLPVGILGVNQYYKQNMVNIKVAGGIGLGLVFGIIIGSKIAFILPSPTLKMLYGFFMLYVASRFFGVNKFFANKFLNQKENLTPNVIKINLVSSVIIGVVAGVLAGMFGLGGGLIIVPILMTIFKFETRIATATSLAALLLPVGLPGVIMYQQHDYLNLCSAVPIAIGMLGGTLAGAKIALNLSADQVKKAYSVFLLVAGLYFIIFQ